MQLAGLQKTTLVDFPGIVAATVFSRGCSFRCHFCHNPELVLPEKFNPLIPEEDFFNFLLERVGKLGGVCITGGEPLLQPDIAEFISHIKALGFKVKLDTNGSFPDRLDQIIKDGDVDYIAMDIKSQLDKYQLVTNPKSLPADASHQAMQAGEIRNSKSFDFAQDRQIQNSKLKAQDNNFPQFRIIKQLNNWTIEQLILRSIKSIMNSNIDYEFRTTFVKPLHQVEDAEGIGKLIKGAKRYYIQNFQKSKHINPEMDFQPFSEKGLKQLLLIIKKFVPNSAIR